MVGRLNSWISDPLVGVMAAMAFALTAGVLWRHFHDRDRRRHDRQRERLRRDYWGFD